MLYSVKKLVNKETKINLFTFSEGCLLIRFRSSAQRRQRRTGSAVSDATRGDCCQTQRRHHRGTRNLQRRQSSGRCQDVPGSWLQSVRVSV